MNCRVPVPHSTRTYSGIALKESTLISSKQFYYRLSFEDRVSRQFRFPSLYRVFRRVLSQAVPFGHLPP